MYTLLVWSEHWPLFMLFIAGMKLMQLYSLNNLMSISYWIFCMQTNGHFKPIENFAKFSIVSALQFGLCHALMSFVFIFVSSMFFFIFILRDQFLLVHELNSMEIINFFVQYLNQCVFLLLQQQQQHLKWYPHKTNWNCIRLVHVSLPFRFCHFRLFLMQIGKWVYFPLCFW